MTDLQGTALDGKIAIVTGAGSGIGRACARRLAAEGMTVVAVDLDADAARATIDELGAGSVVAGSVADPDLWERAVAAAADAGALALVHLNAGLYGYTGAIEELPLDLYQRTVDTNIGGVVLGTRAVVPALAANGGGAIVATASVAGIVPFAPNPLYTLTKQGVTGFVTALAPNLVGQGVSLDCVCPGVVDTPMTVGALGGLEPSALGFTLIAPDDIAAVVVQLATTPGTGRSMAVLPGVPPLSWSFPVWSDLAAATRA